MKNILKISFVIMLVSINAPAFVGAIAGSVVKNLGGAAIGGGAGAAITGTTTNLITGVIQDRKLEKYKQQINCQLNGEKIANWDQPFNLPILDIDSARAEYYAKKKIVVVQ